MRTDETILVRRVRQGNIAAFNELVERYKKKVFYMAFDVVGDLHEAEDVSQEVFIKVFRSINKFREQAKFSSWLYRITINTSLDAQRKKCKSRQVDMDTSELESFGLKEYTHASDMSTPETKTAIHILRQHIRQALPRLSQKERSVFIMRYFNEFKTLEIAEVFNVSVNTVKSLLLRAKKKLRKQLALQGVGKHPGGVL